MSENTKKYYVTTSWILSLVVVAAIGVGAGRLISGIVPTDPHSPVLFTREPVTENTEMLQQVFENQVALQGIGLRLITIDGKIIEIESIIKEMRITQAETAQK
jgi:hypothetical protein